MKQLQIVDMFCGGGGESTGIMQAAKQYNFNVKLSAINHWERAIETHTANYPFATHYQESIQNLDPTKVVPGGKLDLLWASPECTHHSNARGGRPRSDQSRATAWEICKWAQELFIGRIIIENVPEFTGWGPLDENGKPIPEKKGKRQFSIVRIFSRISSRQRISLSFIYLTSASHFSVSSYLLFLGFHLLLQLSVIRYLEGLAAQGSTNIISLPL